MTPAAPASAPRRTGASPAPRRAEPWRPRLRVVAAPGRARTAGLVAATIVFLGLFALAAFQVVIIQRQADLDRLQDAVAEAEAEADDLSLVVATLESPARIVEDARRLGMVEPPDVVYLTPVEPMQGAAP